MYTRIILNIFLGISIVFFPWWLSFLIALVLVSRYNGYEVVGWAFIFDTLYAVATPTFYGFQFVATTVAIVFILAAHYLKQQLIFYP